MDTVAKPTVWTEEFLNPYKNVMSMFKYNIIDLFGDDAFGKVNKFSCVFVYICYLLTTVAHFTQTLAEINEGTDLVHLAGDISCNVLMIRSCIIFPQLCLRRKKIQNVMKKMQKHLYDEPNSDFLRIQAMKTVKIICFIYITLTKLYINTYMVAPWVITSIKKFMLKEETSYMMAYKFKLPFEYINNYALYTLASFGDCIMVVIMAYLFNSDLLILSITITHLKSLFMTLQHDLKTVFNQKFKNADDINNIETRLKNLIHRHASLIGLINELGEAFGAIFAINLIFSTLSVCFFGFSARVTGGDLSSLSDFFACVMNCIYLFICCYHGQCLIDSSVEVGSTVYDSIWYSYPSKVQKYALIIIMRSQQDVQIKSTDFTSISLTTFTQVMKTIWSMFSLIATVYDGTAENA